MFVNTVGVIGQDKSYWLEMLEVLSGGDPETYWAPPGPLLSGLSSASAIREGGGGNL